MKCLNSRVKASNRKYRRKVTSATTFLSSVHFSSSFWISSIPEVAAFSTASDMELSSLLLASISKDS